MGHAFVSGWRVWWGMEENHPNMKNAPHRVCFPCSVGVSREGGGRGTAGEEGVYVSTYINVITKKKKNLLWEWAQQPISTLVIVAHLLFVVG